MLVLVRLVRDIIDCDDPPCTVCALLDLSVTDGALGPFLLLVVVSSTRNSSV